MQAFPSGAIPLTSGGYSHARASAMRDVEQLLPSCPQKLRKTVIVAVANSAESIRARVVFRQTTRARRRLMAWFGRTRLSAPRLADLISCRTIADNTAQRSAVQTATSELVANRL